MRTLVLLPVESFFVSFLAGSDSGFVLLSFFGGREVRVSAAWTHAGRPVEECMEASGAIISWHPCVLLMMRGESQQKHQPALLDTLCWKVVVRTSTLFTSDVEIVQSKSCIMRLNRSLDTFTTCVLVPGFLGASEMLRVDPSLVEGCVIVLQKKDWEAWISVESVEGNPFYGQNSNEGLIWCYWIYCCYCCY